ncbi:uncharacterized protein BCR38DRAFT_78771 [Pseudomassariella vexata]|uniref:CBM1 domain-containing protein n=1 Tax=Pseudomassariella vexata TaxID=1141098 RepID=A0A1Y2DG35_9PEZI|nr:uncharacterized protein BCR38DRAFT_78771 [Pseudomassariella vexata]ORY58241.1 hypothetical protein BCR38DRAFT_78771 [Pseudomassariella vexata]
MKSYIISAVIPLVAGHGYITSPQPRVVGSAMEEACGTQIYNQLKSDINGNIQGEIQNKQDDFTDACNLWLCKGLQFADNTANVQSYNAGDVVDVVYDIRAPHTGVANVSIVDTATNAVIGEPLISWDVFASTSTGVTADETNFSITIPDLAGKCTTAGECVIQHYWNAADVDQTYEACIDFTVGGSSSGGAASSAPASSIPASSTPASSAAPTSAAATTTAPVVTSAAPVATESAVAEDECVADEPTATTSAAAVEETGADDECEAETSAVAVEGAATSSPAATPATDDDTSCDADDTTAVASAVPTTFLTRTATSAAAAATSAAASAAAAYAQCGGTGFTGSTTCVSGYTCTVQNSYYSQCI